MKYHRELLRVVIFGIILNVTPLAQKFRSVARNNNSRPGCLVIAPHEFHSDETETVYVTVPRTPHSNVLVELAFDDGNRKFGRVERTISSSDVSKIFKMKLTSQDLASRKGNVKLHLVANCNRRETVRNHIKISESKKTVVIQTDKPIYTPKQKVLARIYTLDRNLLPIDFPLRIDVVNPQGVIVQRDLNPPDPDDDVNDNNKPGIFHTSFEFPPFPMYGEWQIVVNYGKNFALREKTVFVVEEYELPTFSVELNVDADVIFPVTQDLGLEITSSYVFGGFVKGSAFCKFGIINKNKEIMFRSVSITQFDGAGQHIIIDMDWVMDMFWFPTIEGSRLLIECNVTDSNSIKTITAINRKCIFSRSPYSVDFEKSQGYFKPNLPYFFQADVSYVNGDPAPKGTPVDVVLVNRNGRLIPGTKRSTRTDEYGAISVVLDMKPQLGGRVVQVAIQNFGDRVFEHVLLRDDSPVNRFISVTPGNSNMPLQEGRTVQLNVHASHPAEIATLHHVIISKGMIHNHDTTRFSQGRQINVPITREYVPVVSIMVFYVSNMAGLVSDTISLQVEYDCESRKTFSIANGKTKYYPGEEMTVSMTGPPQTYFTLMAVDQAVYLLRNRSRLTADKMLRVITRDVVKQSELFSSQDAMDQTSVEVLGSDQPNISGGNQGSRSVRVLAAQRRRGKGVIRKQMVRRRVRRDAESGDDNDDEMSGVWNDEEYYYEEYQYEYGDDIEYESGEEQDENPSELVPKIEERAVEVAETPEEIQPIIKQMTPEECCEKAEAEPIISCKAAAMNLTELDVSPECMYKFYNCCLRQQIARIQKQEDELLLQGHYGMSQSHARRHQLFKHKSRFPTTPKMKMKYRNFRLFKSDFTDSEEKDIFEVSSARRNGVVRRFFPESWMFKVYQIGHHSGTKDMTYRVPDSITKWDIQAITLHHVTGLCVLNPREIKVTKDIFLVIDMPYEAVRTEQLEVKVAIHNKHHKKITAEVYLVGVVGICSDTKPNNRSKKVTVSLSPDKQEHVSWAIMPVKVGKYHLRFEIHSRPYDQHSAEMKLVDAVIKPLHVVAEGLERVVTVGSYLLDPGNIVSTSSSPNNNIQRETVRLATPADAIPGSVEAVVKVNGDIMGPAVDTVSGDLNQLLRQPLASGEQTMLNLGPVLFTAKYLKKTNQLSVRQRRRARKRIKQGVQKLLMFRKGDGSFSIWKRANSSVWLTAYVIKIFSESKEFGALSGDPSNILCSAGNWLAKQQKNDGSFREISPFSTRQVMNRDDIEGTVALTAFSVVALETVDCRYSVVIRKAHSYLQQNLNQLEYKPYPLALATYAFSVSNHQENLRAADSLWDDKIMRCHTDSGKCHWPSDRSDLRQPNWYKKPKALEVETASYALLAFINQKNYRRANKVAKWLVEQRNDKGAFVSTQDTMLALEALSLFSTKTRRQGIDLQCVLSASKNPRYRKNIHITEHNSLIQQHIKVSDYVDGQLYITSRGTGIGQAHVHLKYHSRSDDNVDTCKFDLSVEAEEKRLGWEDLIGGANRRRRSMRRRNYTRTRRRRLVSSSYVIELTVCVQYLDKQPTGLAMVEVGLFTGFVPIESQLKVLKTDSTKRIGRFEIHRRGIHFFMDHISNARRTCINFDVRQKQKVGNTQPVAVTVYDLNEPSARCSKFYHPHSNSELREITCRSNGECTCRD